MKNLFVAMMLSALLIGSAGATNSGGKSEVVGEWKYEVPTAPYGYEKGTLIFNEKDGALTGEVKFADGSKIELKDIVYENGDLKCGLYVDYNRVDITAAVAGKKMTGTVKSPEGEMKLTAEKMK